MDTTNDISELSREVLLLSKVRTGEKVALLTTHVHDPHIVGGFRSALGMIGADAVQVILPPRTSGTSWINPIQVDSYAFRILEGASMVVYPRSAPDRILAQGSVANISMYTRAYQRLLNSGVRWLDVMLDESAMRRLFPSPAMIERTKAGAKKLAEADTVRITSESGTHLTVRKRGRKGSAQIGIVDEPGRWDNFGFGCVTCAPEEDQTEGVIVFDVGDSLGQFLGPYYNLLHQPVRIYFEKGQVVKVEGGEIARAYRRHLERLNRPEHHQIAHLGWGTQEKAVWGGPHFTVADWESYYGNVMIHFGHNIFDTPVRNSGLGGRSEPTADWPMPSHSGGVVLNHSVWLDGEQILDKGMIVASDLQ
jgi:2,5-dihydroxypyridine 5,6-dioxygenase